MHYVQRTPRERLHQTLWFEALGLCLVTPLYGWASARALHESCSLLALLSLSVMAWSAAFNTLFDAGEARWCARVASERPHRVRIQHTLAHELGAMLVSCPVLVLWADLDWAEALVADLALTTVYAAYGYAFHCCYDRLRPVRRAAVPLTVLAVRR